MKSTTTKKTRQRKAWDPRRHLHGLMLAARRLAYEERQTKLFEKMTGARKPVN